MWMYLWREYGVPAPLRYADMPRVTRLANAIAKRRAEQAKG